MTDLSPVAQAVLDVVLNASAPLSEQRQQRTDAAAVIRAAADQVVPEHANAVGDEHDDARHDKWMRIRFKLLAIAAELEGKSNEN